MLWPVEAHCDCGRESLFLEWLLFRKFVLAGVKSFFFFWRSPVPGRENYGVRLDRFHPREGAACDWLGPLFPSFGDRKI
jgi:hypothetical protein